MKRFFVVLFIIFVLCGFSFASQKNIIIQDSNPVSFSLITNYTFLSGNSLSKGNVNNLAASLGMEAGDMMNLGIKLTSAGIGNIGDGILWIILGYVFVWLMWEEERPTEAFNSVIAWNISFYGPYTDSTSSLYAGLANFSLIFGIISCGVGVALLIPGIILWAVGAVRAVSGSLKKDQKIVPVVSGDKIGVAIKL